MSGDDALKAFQGYLDISPFQRWLGLKVEATEHGVLTIGFDWREAAVRGFSISPAGIDLLAAPSSS